MKKIVGLVVFLLLLSGVTMARVDEVDPYRQSLTAELVFWSPNLHGGEESNIWGMKSNWSYSDVGAQCNFAPSVLVSYRSDSSGLTFTYDYLNFGGSRTVSKFRDITGPVTVNVNGYSSIFGLAYNFGGEKIWGSVGVKYFNDQNTVSGGGYTYNNALSYIGQPAEDFLPFIGVGLDIPVVPGTVDLAGSFDWSTPIIGSYYDAKLGVRVHVTDGLNLNAGFRTMGWGSDLVTTVVTAPFGMVDNGSVNYNGAYYGLSYYFY